MNPHRPSSRCAAVLRGLGLGLALASAAGCDKPTESQCRDAIANMRRLIGTDQVTSGDNMAAAIRRCRGNSKKSSVQCAVGAKTLDELRACGFYRGKPDEAAGAGSAAPAAGSGSGS
ncbi:MAG: hypothetical protein KBG28_07770 [Kofleriaceae bacterium]|nr:hypothetical protein [Kofleriaceae bacterium]MBP6839039.1 hypothetical protein [Kofleriaceae bacterium]MBP9203841.1 hypothetical protein [Kofleriaceae bacterium]